MKNAETGKAKLCVWAGRWNLEFLRKYFWPPVTFVVLFFLSRQIILVARSDFCTVCDAVQTNTVQKIRGGDWLSLFTGFYGRKRQYAELFFQLLHLLPLVFTSVFRYKTLIKLKTVHLILFETIFSFIVLTFLNIDTACRFICSKHGCCYSICSVSDLCYFIRLQRFRS